MSHDRGCAKCSAEGLGEYRACVARIGAGCFKSHLVARMASRHAPMIQRVERYEHHGREVAVIADGKGKHRERCLCFNACDFFKPGEPDHCEIAKANFELCQAHGIVAPVGECPRYRIAGGWE